MSIELMGVGDSCWMVNSVRSRAYQCRILGVHDDVVVVENLDKGNKQYSFLVSTGEPASSYNPYTQRRPHLYPEDTEWARALWAQFRNEMPHRQRRDALLRLARRLPTDQNWESVINQMRIVLDDWEELCREETANNREESADESPSQD